jgi:hypothetical protein
VNRRELVVKEKAEEKRQMRQEGVALTKELMGISLDDLPYDQAVAVVSDMKHRHRQIEKGYIGDLRKRRADEVKEARQAMKKQKKDTEQQDTDQEQGAEQEPDAGSGQGGGSIANAPCPALRADSTRRAWGAPDVCNTIGAFAPAVLHVSRGPPSFGCGVCMECAAGLIGNC